MKDIQFINPEYFYLLLIIPILLVWYFLKIKKQTPSLSISTFAGVASIKPTWKTRLRHLPIIIRMFAFALIIVAIARPQSSSNHKNVQTEGIDIVIDLDVSTSMLSEDFKPNRLEAAKRTAMDFIDARENDRIGLVIFSAESFTQCPITIDHDVLKNLFESIKTGLLEDGTAIGMGLATSINRLKNSKAKSRVVILLTDGMNNAGLIAPITAAELAKQFGIRVYTVGVGTRGVAPYPFKTNFGIQYQNIEVKIDEDLLRKIADATGGKYFRATNNKALEKIYEEIDKLEKTKIDVMHYSRRSEEFLPYAIAGVALFLLELLLNLLVYKKLP